MTRANVPSWTLFKFGTWMAGRIETMFRSAGPVDARIMQLILGLAQSQALYAAAKLGLADALATGPRSADVIATELGLSADRLERLLRMLAALQVFDRDGSRYALNPLSDRLRSDHPESLRPAVLMFLGEPAAAWTRLADTIADADQIPFDLAHGMPLFDYAAEHPDFNDNFNAAMTVLGEPINAAIAADVDFSGLSTLVDVGGGEGSLLRAIVERNPKLSGILFDQPHVLPPELEARWRDDPIAARISVVRGSFFDAVLPEGADGYLLKWIIHDWPDEAAIRIYQNIRVAMTPRSRLFVADIVLTDDRDPLFATKTAMDLQMMVLLGARERTRAEHHALLERAGFRLDRVIATRSPVSVIEARPA